MKSFKDRMLRLEQLERAQQPEAPPFLCVRSDDAVHLDDPAVRSRYGLTSTAQLPEKIYIGFCTCSWDDDGRSCPVCEESSDANTT